MGIMQSKKSPPPGPSQPGWIIVLKNLGFSLEYFAMILLFNHICFSVCNSMCFCVCLWVRVFRCVLWACFYVFVCVFVCICISVFVAVSMWASREPSTPLITIKLIPTTGQIHNFLTAQIKDKEQSAVLIQHFLMWSLKFEITCIQIQTHRWADMSWNFWGQVRPWK